MAVHVDASKQTLYVGPDCLLLKLMANPAYYHGIGSALVKYKKVSYESYNDILTTACRYRMAAAVRILLDWSRDIAVSPLSCSRWTCEALASGDPDTIRALTEGLQRNADEKRWRFAWTRCCLVRSKRLSTPKKTYHIFFSFVFTFGSQRVVGPFGALTFAVVNRSCVRERLRRLASPRSPVRCTRRPSNSRPKRTALRPCSTTLLG